MVTCFRTSEWLQKSRNSRRSLGARSPKQDEDSDDDDEEEEKKKKSASAKPAKSSKVQADVGLINETGTAGAMV